MSKQDPKSNPRNHTQLRSTGIGRAELDFLRQKIVDLVEQKPEKAAIILSEWMNSAPKGSSSKSPSKKTA